MVRKLVFGLAVTAVTVFGANIAAPRASAAVGDWQKGISIQARNGSDFNSESFRQSVDKASAAGVNNVGLVVQLYQSNQYSSDVQTGWLTPSDQDLASAIRYIRSKGMGATIKVHVDTYNGQWRATISPSDRSSWFANYGAYLNRYASIGQANGATQMILGTEMTSLTLPQYSNQNTAGWQKMIADVRARFSGQLSYSAQHDGYMGDSSLQFWGSLDYIGLSGYYGLGNSADVNSLMNSWNDINNQYIRGLSERNGNKAVVFTEIGYQSKQGTVSSPGDSYARGGATDPTEQANAYQAFFQYWNNYSYVKGVQWWDWSSNPNAGGTSDNDYTPQNKPAQAVMTQWFKTPGAPTAGQGGGGTTPTQPTQPAVPSTYSVTSSNATATNGTAVNSTVTVKANQATTNMLVDVEIYDRNNNRVFQKFYENQTLGTTGSDFTVNWTPASSGDYRIAVGVFSANWQANLLWNDKVATVTSAAAAPVTPTTPVTPTQPTTPTTPTQPTTPTTPTQPTTPPAPTTPVARDISIWWPGTGVTVSGVQPFKARIDSLNVSQYKMYWQVDGDRLNELGDNFESADHKESLVDLTGWNWKANKQYTITFVAKDLAGNVIGTKEAVITIN